MPLRTPTLSPTRLSLRTLRTRAALALLAACAAGASSHAQLPATSPTSLPAPLSAASLPGPVAARPHKATITYAAGLLNVRANDSSLNSILREIARQTGMTITGGVSDQRVFGNYGPAEPSTVLATLLDGTGTNLFLRETADNAPAELVLTPRTGGVTPPSPSAAQDSDAEDEASPQFAAPASRLPLGYDGRGGPLPGAGARVGYAPVPPTATEQAPPTALQQVAQPSANAGAVSPTSGPSPIPQPFNNVLGSPNAVSPSASTLPVTNSVSTNSLATPSTAQPVSGIVDSPSGPPTGTTTSGFSTAAAANASSRQTPTNDADTSGSNTPGGSSAVRTPEQVFQQLQQLRRAAQAPGQSGTAQPAPTTTTPTATPTNPPSSPQ